jgi:hypothetical protein
MDISSARLTSLLREAMTPEAVPSAKADPVKTALVKALVQPPAPSRTLSQPAVPALSVLLPATTAKAQQIASAQIVQAYLALVEPASDAPPVEAVTRKPASASEDGQRSSAMALARVDDGGSARSAGLPWLALVSPQILSLRQASATEAAMGKGQAVPRPSDSARPDRNIGR